MKNAIAIMMIMCMFMFSGCAMTDSQTKDVTKLVTKMMIRTSAYYVALKNPQVIEPGVVACNIILSEEATDEMIKAEMSKILMAYQTEKFKLPPTVTVEDIIEIIQLMGVKMPDTPDAPLDLTELNSESVKFVAKAILQGLEAAKL